MKEPFHNGSSWIVEFEAGAFGPQNSTLEAALLKEYQAMYHLCGYRHRKYGPGNIAASGLLGIVVRIKDKLARLGNAPETSFVDESVFDAWLDVANYATIALLWLKGKWPQALSKSEDTRCPTCGTATQLELPFPKEGT